MRVLGHLIHCSNWHISHIICPLLGQYVRTVMFKRNFDTLVERVGEKWFSAIAVSAVSYSCCVFLSSVYSRGLRGSGNVLTSREFSSLFRLLTLSQGPHKHIHTYAHTQMQLYLTTCTVITQQDVVGWMFEVWRFTQAMTNNIYFSELIICYSWY